MQSLWESPCAHQLPKACGRAPGLTSYPKHVGEPLVCIILKSSLGSQVIPKACRKVTSCITSHVVGTSNIQLFYPNVVTGVNEIWSIWIWYGWNVIKHYISGICRCMPHLLKMDPSDIKKSTLRYEFLSLQLKFIFLLECLSCFAKCTMFV